MEYSKELQEFLKIYGYKDINDQNRYGKTALMIATINDNVKKVKELLNAGADVTIQNKKGDTALIVATRWGNLNTAREILKCYEVEK